MTQLTRDALEVWRAGVDAVRADRVMRESCSWDGRCLTVQGVSQDLSRARRLIVVGAGKAGAGMLAGLLSVLRVTEGSLPRIEGWVNVPEGSVPSGMLMNGFVPGTGIRVLEARPAGVNAPTPLVVQGTERILELLRASEPEDVVIFLLSGGGSALLCAPIDGIDLSTKVRLTSALSLRGATIQELNAVRRCLSEVKGGGISRHCRAKTLITLLISDVLGDPIEMIGSGPTIEEPVPDPEQALGVMDRFVPGEFAETRALLKARRRGRKRGRDSQVDRPVYLLANNGTAVDAAAKKARELGYTVRSESNSEGEGSVEQFGALLVNELVSLGSGMGIISGGEPTVVLPRASESVSVGVGGNGGGRGGRNQHLVLTVGWGLLCGIDNGEEVDSWKSAELVRFVHEVMRGELDFVVVSGGTDGEDGNTQCAGGWIDHQWLVSSARDPQIVVDTLARFDSHSLLGRTGNLLETGPTHTNVCDLRVVLVRRHQH